MPRVFSPLLLAAFITVVGCSDDPAAPDDASHVYQIDYAHEIPQPVSAFRPTTGTNAKTFALREPYVFAPSRYMGTYPIPCGDDDCMAPLEVIDFSDLAQPLVAAWIPVPIRSSDCQIVGDLLYIVSQQLWVSVVDISDPTHPILLGTGTGPESTTFDTQPWRISVFGDRVYCHTYNGLIRANTDFPSHVFDVSDPTHPSFLGVLTTPEYHTALLAEDGVAVIRRVLGFYTAELNGSMEPTILSENTTGDMPQQVARQGDVLYITAGPYLEFWNIADPVAPSLIQKELWADGLGEFRLFGDLMYMAQDRNKIAITWVRATGDPEPGHAYEIQQAAGFIPAATLSDYEVGDDWIYVLDTGLGQLRLFPKQTTD